MWCVAEVYCYTVYLWSFAMVSLLAKRQKHTHTHQLKCMYHVFSVPCFCGLYGVKV